MLSDGPHGIRKQEGAGDQLSLNGSLPATCFPTAATGGDSDKELIAAVKAGKISEELVDRRVDEILDVILSTRSAVDKVQSLHKDFYTDAHHAMAMKASEQSIVLLKNENNILPLKKGSKVAAVNKNVTAVMSAGSFVEMPWLDKCQAMVHGYLCGQAGGSAVLKVILGEVNLSGKLSETYPVKYEDTLSAPYFPAKQRTVEYMEGLYVGYRYFEAGESKTVTIKLDDKEFRYFNVKTDKFEIDGGEYNILIGASVADIKLTGTVTVEGTSAAATSA